MGKKKVKGGLLALIGYILSPLSWWNDAFVNIPISYFISSLLTIFLPKDLFPIIFILAYNGTNVLGFILMHIGAETAVKEEIKMTRKTLFKYIIVSAFYTILVYILIKIGLIEPIQEFLK